MQPETSVAAAIIKIPDDTIFFFMMVFQKSPCATQKSMRLDSISS
jgi:hypothetical protein